MDRDQLQEHLRFAAELGIVGVSRDAAWRQRVHPARSASPETSGATADAPVALVVPVAADVAVAAGYGSGVPVMMLRFLGPGSFMSHFVL